MDSYNKLNIRIFFILSVCLIFSCSVCAGTYTFTIKGEKTYLNGKEFLVKGLRCSNALISDKTADELIANLDTFKDYGLNTVSVYFMGSRFGDVKGYNQDCTLNPIYSARMSKIIEAADQRGMVILVGCLYWGNSKAKWPNWTQQQANTAVANTVRWLEENDYRNVFVDVDNEGMSNKEKGFDIRQLVLAGKAVDPNFMIATNYRGEPVAEADMAIHFSKKVKGKPYIETEGTPGPTPIGPYWKGYSRKTDLNNYLNIGEYSDQMKASQKAKTIKHLNNGNGYMMASTWLQAVPPYGPNPRPGGDGTKTDPGIKWWLEFLKETYSPHVPQK